MKKSIIALLLLPLMLGACDFNPSNHGENTSGQTQQNEEEQQSSNHNHHQPINHNEDDDEEEQEIPPQQEEEEEENQPQHEDEEEEENTGENEENHQQNSNISLDEWQEYEFHNGHKPAWNDDWDFYYGDTYKPLNSCFFECPNENLDYSGIKFFDKKEYLISPNFNSYPKVEVRFQFWMSAKTGSKYKAVANEPQFKIEEFDSTNKLINTDNLFIEKSDVHNNNTPTEKKLYITQNKMSSFIVRFNNFVPNGDSGYMPVLCKISLKGWQYV